MASWYQTSRPSSQSTVAAGALDDDARCGRSGTGARALSALALSGTCLPPRTPSSAVITTWQSESRMRSRSASGEKPPKTTECTAPMRAQASMATAASGIIGM